MSRSMVLFVLLLVVVAEARVINYNRFDVGVQQSGDNSYDYDANQIIRNLMKRNRQCLLNAGLSAGCDLSDLVNSKTQSARFMSFAGPGK